MLRLAADWVLPVVTPPIAAGAVLLDDGGRITMVGRDADVPWPESARTERLAPGVALLPGLVNTHTHLELTGFAGMVNEPRFDQWIASLIRVKAARSEEAFFDAACRGIESMWSAGVTTICDTGSTGAVIAALDHLHASGTAHHEVFGAHPEQVDRAMSQFERDLDRLACHATGRVGLGVSPHAPYTVSGALYRASCDLARAHGVPIAVHTAEPADESALLRDFTGVFAEWFRAQGVERPTRSATSPVAYMDAHGVLGTRTLCIHAIHVDAEDTRRLSQHGVAMAHCPRSNRFHHQADAPIRRYIEAGLRVGIGTDSEVSVDPPDLLREAAAASRLAGWTPAEALRALTLGGAEAIECAGQAGSIEVGKWGDFAAIRVGDTLAPEAAILAATRAEVVGTWLAGREVYRQAG
ncbi:MAG TPA: TatD family hydrolase [Gemmatimonadales bacterium]|nr:TatD family hydrolase [Gemmatimonadales bacterium]